MEVGKALRTNGTNGHGYPEAAGRAANYLNRTKTDASQHTLASEEAVVSAAVPRAATDLTEIITRAWIAADAASVRLIQEARSIARTSSAVLIRGESGTGKDLLAWILHALGPRASHPFVRIDCASMPPEVIETELFGHENGSPSASQVGRLELASGGTLVLDEVAALSIASQARLLRLIEDRRFDPASNGHGIGIDTRIIALTATNLDQSVARRAFREDLYYRLNVIPMTIPPLRDRPADIACLAEAFLDRLAEMHRRPRLQLDTMAAAALESYSYPGNVRELRNVIEGALQTANGPEIHVIDLPPQVRESFSGAARNRMSLDDMERAYIQEVLDYTRGKKTLAAKILGISRKTLLEKRKRYGLD